MSSELLQHSLFYGMILTVVMVITFLTLLWINPEMWLDDYPPDIQARFGEMSEKAKKQKWVAGILVLTFFFGVVIVAAVRWTQAHPGQTTFGDIFWSSFLIFNLFNLVDLLILDWLILRASSACTPCLSPLAGERMPLPHLNPPLKIFSVCQ